jgi:hypothetical protein
VEVVPPRTNAAMVTPVENLLAAISRDESFGLEIAGTSTARWFLARAGTPAMRRHLEAQLAVAYPQAALRRLDPGRLPGHDPARLAGDEQVAACALALRAPPYLPLRTFRDADVDDARDAQADPVLGVLGALDDLPAGWRGLTQVVLRPAADDWCRPYLRLAVEHPLAAERAGAGAGGAPSLTGVVVLAGLLAAGAAAAQGALWYADGEWLRLALLAGAVPLGGAGLVWLGRRLGRRPLYDVRLVQEKVSRPAFVAQLRLAVFAPAGAPRPEVEGRLAQLVAAYRQFNLAAGNGLVPHRLDPDPRRGRDLRSLAPLPPARAAPVLTTRELAGLWHLPQALSDVPLLERTTARRRLPLPVDVARGCPIGVSAHQGRAVPVALPDDLLRRHLLLVAKTRRGKSSLLLLLARHLMDHDAGGGRRPALVLVDPHRDFARAALGVVPAARRDAVVYLDAAEGGRPFGLNLLDTALFPDRDKAVANTLAVFRREFDRFWGPRMEDAFRFALLTLYEANEALCAADPSGPGASGGGGGRGRQHTILDVPAVLVDPAFRRRVLEAVADPVVLGWWGGYFDRLDRRLQVEVSNPVQTKVHRFAGSRAARRIVGQPRSTIDPPAWVRDGAVVVVNTARGTVGEDTAALLGATLLNLVGLAIGEQAALDPARRRPVTLVVDEFHTMPGADYEGILAELAKYGANLVLATQSLAKLTALDREQHRALRSTVFANLDGLFAFHTSAEDAEYLVRELGEGVDEHDLVALGEHQCYVRVSAAGERLPVFSVRLDPPTPDDPALADRLAAASAARFGRDAGAVDRDVAAAAARVAASHRVAGATAPGTAGEGVAHGAPAPDAADAPDAPPKRAAAGGRSRAEPRRQRRRRGGAHQATVVEASAPPRPTAGRTEDADAWPGEGTDGPEGADLREDAVP